MSPPTQEEGRWARARRLGEASFAVIRSDRRLLLFPFLSALTNAVLGGLAFAAADGLISGHRHTRLVILLGTIIASYPTTFVGLFTGVALAAMLRQKLDGERVDVRAGWRCARRRTGIILAWTLLVCTVGAVFRALEEYVPLGGRIAALALDLAWSLATLFAVPVIAYEGLGPLATLRRSASLFRERWGEQTAGVVGVGVLAGVAVIPGVLVILAGVAKSGAGAVLLVAIGGAWVVAVATYANTLNLVYRIYLYRSTLPGAATVSGPFTAQDLANPLQKKRRWWRGD
jgi:hypothetical protein